MKNLTAMSYLLAVATVVFARASEAQETQQLNPAQLEKFLEKMEGAWDATVSFDGPQGALTANGKETNKLMPGGLWLVSNFTMDFYQGNGLYGFDTKKKQPTCAWVDSHNSTLAVSQGSLDSTGKILTLTHENDPVEGAGKIVITLNDDGSRTFVATGQTPDGKTRTMTITYKRAKE